MSRCGYRDVDYRMEFAIPLRGLDRNVPLTSTADLHNPGPKFDDRSLKPKA